MWELDYKESWAPKNWCFWTVVLEKTLESPLDCKEKIKPVHLKGNQSWIFTGRTDDEAEASILWPPDVKNWLIEKAPDAGNDWRQGEKGMTEVAMVGWHHRLDGHEFQQVPAVGDEEGSLAWCSPLSCKEVDTTEWLNRSEFKKENMESRIPLTLLNAVSKLSVQFSCSVASDSLRPHESQQARPPCPSTPRVYPNSCPLSQWCHPAISSSVIPFSSCPQSLPASGSFPVSQLFTSGGQSIGVSASTSVLPMNTQDWSPLEWTGWTSLQSKGLSRVFSTTTVQKHQFFGAQLSSQSNSHIHTWPLEKP